MMFKRNHEMVAFDFKLLIWWMYLRRNVCTFFSKSNLYELKNINQSPPKPFEVAAQL